MKAIVVEQPGKPEVLQLKEIPTPDPRAGWVLIKIRAFGLNRSEMYTRQGQKWLSVSQAFWAMNGYCGNFPPLKSPRRSS